MLATSVVITNLSLSSVLRSLRVFRLDGSTLMLSTRGRGVAYDDTGVYQKLDVVPPGYHMVLAVVAGEPSLG